MPSERHVRQIEQALDLLYAALASGDARIVSYSIGGRSFSYGSRAEILDEIQRLEAIIARQRYGDRTFADVRAG